MNIRRFRSSDADVLARYYDPAKHGDKCPDFGADDMKAVYVAVDANDVPRMALGGRLTVEVMLMADPDWETPAARWAALKMLARELFRFVFRIGIRSGHCWIEDTMPRAWARRLGFLGMVRDGRKSFRIEVEG